MAYTISTPASRARKTRPRRASAGPLLETALLAAIALALVGGMYVVSSALSADVVATSARLARGEVLDLSTANTAEAIAPYLVVFPTAAERQFAAREVLEFMTGAGAGPTTSRTLPNVGILARVTVDAARIDATRGLTTLRERLRDRRAQASTPPSRLPLFTAAQVAALKPSLVVRSADAFQRTLRWYVMLVVAAFAGVHLVRRWRGAAGDPLMLPVLFALSGLGLVLMVSLRDPLRDVMLVAPFAQGIAAGCLALLAATFVDLERSVLPRLSYVPLVGALLLSVLLVTLGSGPGGSDARVNLFGVQPVDAIRLLITLFLAGYFARRWELLRELEGTDVPAGSWWRHLRAPRRQDVIPVVVGVGVMLAGFFLQKDLGPALLVACAFLGMYAVARGRWVVAVSGLALLVAGFVVGYVFRISSTLATRIEIWRSPWDNGARGGDQVAQSLWALASGGWTGTGLGRGMPTVVPAVHTDLILAALGEELGFVGLMVAALLFVALAARGFRAARLASGEYSALLAVGLTLGLVLPVLVIGAGLLGLAPLTGVVTPFLSYGRSALVANFLAAGLLLSIADRRTDARGAEPFARGVRNLGVVMGVVAGLLVLAAVRTQVVSSADVMTAGTLTRQGDGLRRYSYNPRLVAMADLIPRGSIVDRTGLPVAFTRLADAKAAEALFAALGVKLAEVCPDSGRRCYPFGGPFFHLLGNADTQVNWAAPNTSFAEREFDTRLRGYDDQARVVEVTDPASGAKTRTIRRSLRALLPLWKHRDDLTHPEAKAVLDRPRDVRLTVDARLQARVATLLRERLAAARLKRGAVVVVEATSGALLAAVSYPWPEATRGRGPRAAESADGGEDVLLDRARYGVYPPGSTFKLVTAAAVLRTAPALADEPLVCRRLDDARVGNVVPGWRRPIRDDVTDKEPHGDVLLERGLVQSCNAYFAQLGAKLGGKALRDTASLFEISLTRGDAPERLRDTLPFASYGQGEVLATPYRMARVAAAIAADGVLAPPRVVVDDPNRTEAAPVRVLDQSSARRLADAMREVVVSGTGRGLMAHPEFVAGKTGTAEVEGAASHSWFVGFAPHGARSPRRIAFAVIVENGGYGGRAAAPLAGEVVTAARQVGLLAEGGE